MKPENMKAYKTMGKMYESLRECHDTFPKLSKVFRLSIDFAILQAVRETIKDFDENERGKEFFFTALLLQNMTEAIYQMGIISLRRMEKGNGEG